MAFPTTSVLDDFNRANSATLGANWSEGVWLNGSLEIVSNQCSHQGSNNDFSDAYWAASTFGPDSEAFATVVTWSPDADDLALMCRLSTPSATTMDGYLLSIVLGSPDTWRLYSLNNNAFGTAIATQTQNVSDGDSIGIEAIGTTIKGYHKPAAGAWTEILSATNSDHSGAGSLGLYAEQGSSGNVTLDDFGGGTVVASATAPRTLKMMGIGN